MTATTMPEPVPVRYTWWLRWTDRRRGRKDGKAGHPRLPANVTEAPPTQEQLITPHIRVLLREHEGTVARERQRTGPFLSPLVEQIAELSERERACRRAVKAAEEALAGMPESPTDVQLTLRTEGELLAKTDDAICEARRLEEHLQRRDDLGDALRKACGDLADAETTIAVRRLRIKILHADESDRVGEHEAFARLRMETYVQALLDKHPRPDLLQWWSSGLSAISLATPPATSDGVGGPKQFGSDQQRAITDGSEHLPGASEPPADPDDGPPAPHPPSKNGS